MSLGVIIEKVRRDTKSLRHSVTRSSNCEMCKGRVQCMGDLLKRPQYLITELKILSSRFEHDPLSHYPFCKKIGWDLMFWV